MGARGSDRLVDAVEELLAEVPARLRGSRTRLSEQALGAVRAIVAELDLVSRDDVDELELRVAQLEHRLRLIEQPPGESAPPTALP
jgi:BMFP domain-containing protein YqiC